MSAPVELAVRPGCYVTATQAQRLIASGRARLTSEGRILFANEKDPEGEERRRWTSWSGGLGRRRDRPRWLAGYRMNGDVINHG